MAFDPDLEPIVRVVARRTGYEPEVVALILDEAVGMLRARVEWEITNAKEEGLRLGAKMGFAAKEEAVLPHEDGFSD